MTIAGLPTLHSVNDVAKQLDRNVYALRAYIRRNNLDVVKVSRNNWRLTDEQVAALLAHLTKNHDAPDLDGDMDRDRERARQHAARTTAPKPRRTAA